jgi:hypothetical protein
VRLELHPEARAELPNQTFAGPHHTICSVSRLSALFVATGGRTWILKPTLRFGDDAPLSTGLVQEHQFRRAQPAVGVRDGQAVPKGRRD